MKKFRKIIIFSVVLYLVTAFVSGLLLVRREQEADRLYRVEINRIYNTLRADFQKPDMDAYTYVKRVDYLENGSSGEEVLRFFDASASDSAEIRPWYEDGQLQGYLRFQFENPNDNTGYILLVSEAGLLGLELCILIFLFYLNEKLVKPFHQMTELPGELSRGHFIGEINEEEGRYFGDFQRSVGRLRDTLAVAKKRELELIREKKTMLLSLAHDIKTPLNTIKLYTKALTDGIYDSEEQQREAIVQIGHKAEQIEQYVEDIMAASREDILDIQVEKGEFYLADLMESVLKVYREKCSLRMMELKVGSYGNCLLKGDLERAREVLENVLENAFKYGDGQRIEITFSEEEYCRLIHIYNTGATVSDNDINHIFESFFRGANSGRQQGNGLGLYICREIMHRMGGEIYAEKSPGGMSFVVVLV